MTKERVFIIDDRFYAPERVELEVTFYQLPVSTVALYSNALEGDTVVEPYSTYTVNLTDYSIIPEKEYQVIIADYSEHEGGFAMLEKQGIVKRSETFITDDNGEFHFGPFQTKAIMAEIIHPELRARIDRLLGKDVEAE